MKKIPEAYDLNEEDIKQAIRAWIIDQPGSSGLNYEVVLTIVAPATIIARATKSNK